MAHAGLGAWAWLPALLLAGCIQTGQGTTTLVLPEPGPVGWAQGSIEGRGAEPALALAPDGTLYLAARAREGDGHAARAWRSDDGGASWQGLDLRMTTGARQAALAAGPDGALWLAAQWERVPVLGLPSAGACTGVARSADGGRTWTEAPVACGATLGHGDRPWLATSGAGAHLLHFQYAPAPTGHAGTWFLAGSADGAAWRGLPTPLPLSAMAGPLVAHAGGLSFPYAVVNATEQFWFEGPVVATTTDGIGWSVQPVARERVDARFPGLAVGAARSLAVWAHVRDDHTGSQLRAAWRGEGAWGPAFNITSGGTAALPWVAAQGDRFLVAWLHAETRRHPHEMPAGEPWRAMAWLDGAVHDLGEAHRGPLCTATHGPACPHGSAAPGDFLAASFRADGAPLVAFASSARAHGEEPALRVMVGPLP